MKKQQTILVIEDNTRQACLLQLVLKEQGFKCFTASTCRDGLEVLSKHWISLIILDLHLPDGSGLEIIRGLQTQTCPNKNPVIIVTSGAPPSQEEQRLAQEGYLSRVTKPYEINVLTKNIEQALSKQNEP